MTGIHTIISDAMDELLRINLGGGTQGGGAGGFTVVEDKTMEEEEEEKWALQFIQGEKSSSADSCSSLHEKKGLPAFSSAASAKKIEEIFGREEGDEDDGGGGGGEVVEVRRAVGQPKKTKKKQRKCRSLADIYRVTKPLEDGRHFKKMMFSC